MFGLHQLSFLLVVIVCVATSSSFSGVLVLAQTPTTRSLRVQHDGPHAVDGSPLPYPVTVTTPGAGTTTAMSAVAAAPAPGTLTGTNAMSTMAQIPPAPAAAVRTTAAAAPVPTTKPGKVKNPGGLLGPLYAAFPTLLKPLALVSDTIHNSNAALTGVQHTPDGIFEA